MSLRLETAVRDTCAHGICVKVPMSKASLHAAATSAVLWTAWNRQDLHSFSSGQAVVRVSHDGALTLTMKLYKLQDCPC